jgi:superfamily II DNA or RNA helicase
MLVRIGESVVARKVQDVWGRESLGMTAPPLRDYQRHAIDELRQHLHANPILVIPTGGGKTRTAAEFVREFPGRTLWLAHRRELIKQAAASLEQSGLRVGIIQAGYPSYASRPVQVASVQTLARRTPPAVDLIVIDESHHTPGRSFQQLLEHYTGIPRIGLTATPFRLDGRPLGDTFGYLVVAAHTDELVERGLLIEPRVYAPPPASLTGIRVTRGDFETGRLATVCDKPKLIGDIVQTWQRFAAGRRTVVFAVNVEHSRHIIESFVAAGVAAEHLDGSTPLAQRDAALKRLASGETLVLSNCNLVSEGWDLPALDCAILARPTASLCLHIQQVGRIMRACHGKSGACIAEGELVLTEHGLVPIEKVSRNSRVWDGVEWVNHDGPIYRGLRDVTTYAGLTATADHQVATKAGWRSFGECALEQVPIKQTGFGRKNIRECAGYFSRCSASWWKRKATAHFCFCRMRQMPTQMLDSVRQYFSRTIPGLSQLQSASTNSEMAFVAADRCETAMHQSKELPIQKLRCARNLFQVRIDPRCWPVDSEKSRTEAKLPIRSDRQQRSLRTGEPTLVHADSKYVAYSHNKTLGQIPSVPSEVSTYQIFGFNPPSPGRKDDIRANRRPVEFPVMQTKRRVWDLLNCGPRHRFTVSNLLVHNCVLDHAGNFIRHGRVTRRIEYSLDGPTRALSSSSGLRTCPQCYRMVISSRTKCPECGAVFAAMSNRELPESAEGDLQEYNEAEHAGPPPATPQQKKEFFDDIAAQAAERGWKPGAVAHRFREKFGVWPTTVEVDGVARLCMEGADESVQIALLRKLEQERLEKNFKPGYAAARFKSAIGHWPSGAVRTAAGIGQQEALFTGAA